MLGYQQTKDNNLYFFFEDDELERIAKETIVGKFVNVNHQEHIGDLTVSVDDDKCREKLELVLLDLNRAEKGYLTKVDVTMRESSYQRVKERGISEPHLGYMHVCFRDSNRLEFNDDCNYNVLKEIVKE